MAFLVVLDCNTGRMSRYKAIMEQAHGARYRRVEQQSVVEFDDWSYARTREGHVAEAVEQFRKYGCQLVP